eukprot:gene15436-20825_t
MEATTAEAVFVEEYDNVPIQAVAVMDNYSVTHNINHNPDFPPVHVDGLKDFLTAEGFPEGLQESFVSDLSKYPFRFFICDDSGSMMENDGRRLVKDAKGNQKWVDCSRWAELTDMLKFCLSACISSKVAAEFRLLNGELPILLGVETGENESENILRLRSAFDRGPQGLTPLCKHINEVVHKIKSMERSLLQSNQKALVIIATDGEASDGDIAQAMAPLKSLPVSVVLRLCTDENKVVDYWNDIDKHLELSMDVIDDFSGEANEIYEKNSWLNYGQPIHRCREFGTSVKELDLLDEKLLLKEQVRRLAKTIFGGDLSHYPDPEVDWNEFVEKIDYENERAPKVWNPITKTNSSWINISMLNSKYTTGPCTIS